ncbi:restriction endonuclease subunit S [Kriegella aquimaris]|uniref:Type I restriction enzyme, S subunit n=1 Tax=Kriegella aquimaris TaxID=192904 RepID=A0A1G9V168_9FLAO|nr:restriction endonuclease subunit S [Kriegella aquimaris]SDM66031.1 type I restriction enzyme, S subunit [Kriegella aquimaris]
MEALLEERLSIDKTRWTLVKFGDVVFEPKESTKNPIADGIEHVVGLEHIESEDIHLRNSATLEEATTFTKRFSKGDVLFGRRRAYLKKAAQASFSGICSGDITVFRAKENLLPELLPFVVQNEKFFDYAIKHSAGGLSPRVKFKDLANYEFLLPPKDQQAKLAKLLWAMDEVIERENDALKKLESTLNSNIENEIHGISIKGKVIREILEEYSKIGELIPLINLGELLKGKGIPKTAVKEEGFPCVRYGELYTKHHRIIREFNSFISQEDKSKSLLLKKDDVLFAGSGETITEIGKSASFVDNIEAYAGSDTLIFRPYDMNGYYLGYLMNSQFVRQQLNKYGTGATVMHIYNSDLAKVKVPKIDKNKQIEIAKKLESISKNIFGLESKKSSSKALQKSLINQVF